MKTLATYISRPNFYIYEKYMSLKMSYINSSYNKIIEILDPLNLYLMLLKEYCEEGVMNFKDTLKALPLVDEGIHSNMYYFAQKNMYIVDPFIKPANWQRQQPFFFQTWNTINTQKDDFRPTFLIFKVYFEEDKKDFAQLEPLNKDIYRLSEFPDLEALEIYNDCFLRSNK